MQPNLGIPEQLPQSNSHLQVSNAEGSRLGGRLGSSANAPLQLHDEYGDETQDFDRKPKIVKDFAKAYMQVRFLLYRSSI